jgi:hypothetical protein
MKDIQFFKIVGAGERGRPRMGGDTAAAAAAHFLSLYFLVF